MSASHWTPMILGASAIGLAAFASRAQEPSANDAALAGRWRVLSARLFYDAGGAGAVGDPIFRDLELSAEGSWKFGASEGRWTVSAATAADWKRWKVEPYGPTRKLTLSGWSGGEASGPIEESDGPVHYLWAIYHAEPPAVSAPGDVHMKFGRR